MQAHFSVRPRQERLPKNGLAVVVENLDEAEAVHACVEGAWEEVVSVIRGFQQAMAVRHPHVITTVVFVDRTDEASPGLKKRMPRFAAPLDCADGLVRTPGIPDHR